MCVGPRRAFARLPGSCYRNAAAVRHDHVTHIQVEPSSIKLFGAWSAKHKEIIAVEDRIAEARDAGADVTALEAQLLALRADAEARLEAAMERFRAEVRARGLTQ